MINSKFVYDITSQSIVNDNDNGNDSITKKSSNGNLKQPYRNSNYTKPFNKGTTSTKDILLNKMKSRMKYDKIKNFLIKVMYELNVREKIQNDDSIERISIELDFDKNQLSEFIFKRPTWPKNLLGKFVSYISKNETMLGVSTLECLEAFKKISNITSINHDKSEQMDQSESGYFTPYKKSFNYKKYRNSCSDSESDSSDSEIDNISDDDEMKCNDTEMNSIDNVSNDNEDLSKSTSSFTNSEMNSSFTNDVSTRVICIPTNTSTYNKDFKGLQVFTITTSPIKEESNKSTSNEIDRKITNTQELASIPKLKLEHFIHEISEGDSKKKISLKNFFKSIELLNNCIESYDKKCSHCNHSIDNTENCSLQSNESNNSNTNSVESNVTKGYHSYPYNSNINNNNNSNNNTNNTTTSTTNETSSTTTTTTTTTTGNTNNVNSTSNNSSSKIPSVYQLENILLKSIKSFLDDYLKE